LFDQLRLVSLGYLSWHVLQPCGQEDNYTDARADGQMRLAGAREISF
jgi:hypothetical protein